MDQLLYRYNKPPKCNLWEIYAIDRDGRQVSFPKDTFTPEAGCTKINASSEDQARRIAEYYKNQYGGWVIKGKVTLMELRMEYKIRHIENDGDHINAGRGYSAILDTLTRNRVKKRARVELLNAYNGCVDPTWRALYKEAIKHLG